MNNFGVRVAGALTIAAAAGALAFGPAGAQPAAGAPPAGGPALVLTLDRAIAAALANNLSYRSALADERIARGRVTQAGAGRLPTLSAGYQYVHNQYAGYFTFPNPGPSPGVQKFIISASDINNLNATLQYAVFSGGAVQAAIGQAAAGLAASESQLSAARANVIRDTTTAYFALVSAQDIADIDRLAVIVARQNLDVANKLYRAGTAAKEDVLRAQVALANDQVTAVQGANAAALANASLANELNINLSSQITPTEPLAVSMPAYSLDQVLDSAKSKRPELAAAHDAVLIAEHAIRAARAGSLPTVAISVEEGSSKPNFTNVPQPNLSETLSVTWRLFDGGLTAGKVSEAGAQLDKAHIQLQQLDNSVDLEVRQAFLNYGAAQAQVAAAKTAQASADESLRVTEIRYRSGVGTSLELADAALADTQARTQVVNSLVSLRTALTNLQRAAGLL